MKFLRNLECILRYKSIDLDVVLSALLYHSTLDIETIEYIKSSLIDQDFLKKL